MMELAIAFGVAIFLGLGALVVGMYAGGGVEAIRRQSGTLGLLAVVLVAIGLVIFLAGFNHNGLAIVVPVVAGASAIVAGLQARALSIQRRTTGIPILAIVMWLVAALMSVIAMSSALLLLT